MSALLDNVFWHALSGLQAQFASGAGAARRFAPGFSPIVGFADPQRPAFADLDPFCAAGERFYCDAWDGPVPAGWRVELEAPMCQMVWDAAKPVTRVGLPAVQLRQEHAPLMHELALATNPGPFGPRTPGLGEYWGVFDGARLVAMAGERLHVPGFREISGVCTLPEHRGRGLARDLVALLVQRQLARGETPFLHVLRANEAARALYLAMGFAERHVRPVRVVTKL